MKDGQWEVVFWLFVCTIIGFAFGRIQGDHAALDQTYTDERGRNCIILDMYERPNEGWNREYGGFGNNGGRTPRIFCQDKYEEEVGR